jgi:hypothetical protein
MPVLDESGSYYQTNELTARQTQIFEFKAESQERQILNIVASLSWKSFTAEGLQPFFPGVPMTSLRRGLSNLKSAGKIERCGQTIGPYNRPVSTYRFPGLIEV